MVQPSEKNNRFAKKNMKEDKREMALTNESKRIVEQAIKNGTHEILMSAVHEYQQTHSSGIPKHCILTKYEERILKEKLKCVF